MNYFDKRKKVEKYEPSGKTRSKKDDGLPLYHPGSWMQHKPNSEDY